MKISRLWGLPLLFLTLLLIVLSYGTAEKLHGRLLSLGEQLFPQYSMLRTDPSPPSCSESTAGATAEEHMDD